MTRAELLEQFTFLRQVAAGAVVTHYARDRSGRFVMVHALEGVTGPLRAALVGGLKRLGPSDRARVLQELEVDGAPVIVTEYLQGFSTFAAWIESRAIAAPAAANEPGQGAPPTAAERRRPGEFTQLFGPSADPGLPEAPAPAAPVAPPPPAPPVVEAPVATTKGNVPFDPDATVVLTPQGPVKPTASVPPTREPPAAAPPPVAPAASAPARTPEPPPTAPPPQRSKPVVRWREDAPAEPAPAPPPVVRWKAPKAESTEPPPRPMAPAPAPPPPPPVAPAPPAPPAPPKRAGEFTMVFGPAADLESAVPPAPPPASPPPTPPIPPPAREAPRTAPPTAGPPPGDFTRMFRPSPEPTASPPPSSRQPDDYLRALHDTPPPVRESPPPPLREPPPPPPAGAPSAMAQPGEFTRLMAGLPSTPPAASPAPAAPGSFTQIISPQSAAARPAPAPPPPRPAEPAVEPAADEEPAERDPRTTVLIIALAAMGLAAVLLVLFVVLT